MPEERKKKPWRLAAAIAAILTLALAGAAYVLVHWQTSPRRPADRYGGDISAFQSSQDRDGDGLDDQTDILEGALAYVQTCPVYESVYYAGGWPDDGRGVCTDVVAFALRDAGYDLQELVSADIAAHREDYAIEVTDRNIDYRRVRNLLVYLTRNAVTLTPDVSDVAAWQGGDIVVFDGHIGVVSDRRNQRGVPYVIHHGSRHQWFYEQDILEKRDDILGHFRISQ